MAHGHMCESTEQYRPRHEVDLGGRPGLEQGEHMGTLLLKYFRRDYIYILLINEKKPLVFYVANKNDLLACFREYSNSRRVSGSPYMRAGVTMRPKLGGPRVLIQDKYDFLYRDEHFKAWP